MTLNKLTPFKGWTLENFPFIEADFDALTNYELICKITEYINKVAEQQNNLNQIYIELYNGYKELYDYVNQYLVDIDEVKQAIARIDASLDELAADVLQNSQDIILINSRIDSVITELRAYVDSKVLMLEEEIQNIQIGDISVYDPTTGEILPLQIVINNLYGLTNKDGLTATEFDALDLTATAFDAYQITAYEFDSSGKTILV